jgi:copper(I)-binding protein
MRVIAFLLALLLSASAFASGEGVRAGDIVILAAWGRPSIGGSPGSLYLTLRNEGSTADRLVAVSTAAGTAMLHESYIEDGVAKMRMLDSVDLPPGATVTLAPGHIHIMVSNLAAPMREGDLVPVDLTFEKAGTVRAGARIGRLGASGP